MIRQLDILITKDGTIKIHGDDLPELAELEELLGKQAEPEIEEIVKNCRLCG